MGTGIGKGLGQDRRFSSQMIGVSGRRLLSALSSVANPTTIAPISGAPPTGFVDHGTIVGGKVEISVDVNVDSIDIGRLPSPLHYYMTGQKGMIKCSQEEYQPEMIDLAAGGDGDLDETPAAGGSRAYMHFYIGGQMGAQRKLIVYDSFDVDFANDGFAWDQYQWLAIGQASGSFTQAEEKAAIVVPVEYNLLTQSVDSVSRLLEFYAVKYDESSS
jgi:hypothetical protein